MLISLLKNTKLSVLYYIKTKNNFVPSFEIIFLEFYYEEVSLFINTNVTYLNHCLR